MTDIPNTNYIVTINGRHKHPAETEEQVWDIIGRYPMGALYMVDSPKGLPLDQFTPF